MPILLINVPGRLDKIIFLALIMQTKSKELPWRFKILNKNSKKITTHFVDIFCNGNWVCPWVSQQAVKSNNIYFCSKIQGESNEKILRDETCVCIVFNNMLCWEFFKRTKYYAIFHSFILFCSILMMMLMMIYPV